MESSSASESDFTPLGTVGYSDDLILSVLIIIMSRMTAQRPMTGDETGHPTVLSSRTP